MTSFRISRLTVTIADISAFQVAAKAENDKNNKMREVIVGAIINKKVPEEFYTTSPEWYKMREACHCYLNEIGVDPSEPTLKVAIKGGRRFNYDMLLTAAGKEYKIELKFNAKTVADCPQFSSPMNPSRFFTGNETFESYFYDNYLPSIAEHEGFALPDKATYVKEVGTNKPPCMAEYQRLYYGKGEAAEKFNAHCKEVSEAAINSYLEKYDLRCDLLTNYLINSQRDKIYMLWDPATEKFHVEYANLNDYVILIMSRKSHNSFYCSTMTGKRLKVMMRWKNGNGIAYPAFQIS